MAAVACAGALGLLGACSPTFNWREAAVGDSGLVAMLPCKPDRAERQLPLGSQSVRVVMAGCEAGGATFAVAQASAADATQAAAWIDAWRAATRRQLGEAGVVESEAALPRAADRPAPVRLDRGAQLAAVSVPAPATAPSAVASSGAPGAPDAPGAPAGTGAATAPASPASPASSASKPSASTSTSSAHFLWFAQALDGGRYAIYQAAVVGAPREGDALLTFFEGLHLP